MTPARLFEVDARWEVVPRSDAVVNRLADRHYPRRSPTAKIVAGPGSTLVLRWHDWTAGWVTYHTEVPDDGLDAWRCTMFRNEGPALSSTLIRLAMTLTAERWADRRPPADGWLTYVDTAQVAAEVPGWCFRRAGWRRDRTYHPDRRRSTLIRLTAPL